eukprot:5933074-Amphidinium_carterae.1
MDPTPAELARWAAVGDVLAWAGIVGTAGDVSTPLGSLLNGLGFAGGEHWLALALITLAEVESLL